MVSKILCDIQSEIFWAESPSFLAIKIRTENKVARGKAGGEQTNYFRGWGKVIYPKMQVKITVLGNQIVSKSVTVLYNPITEQFQKCSAKENFSEATYDMLSVAVDCP